MCLTIIAHSKFKKRHLGLINNGTHQSETLSERPIRQPLSRSCSTIIMIMNNEYYVHVSMIFASKNRH